MRRLGWCGCTVAGVRWLEVRRHSLTKKGATRGRGSHLSAPGVALARAVGAELGTIAYAVTSVAPRAIETAIAMGVAVDDTVDLPSGYVPGQVEHHEQWSWVRPYARYRQLIDEPGGLDRVAEAHRSLWGEVLHAVPDGGVGLIVSHGGAIEPALVACFPNAEHESWGAPFAHCDGARLGYADGTLTGLEFRRAPSWTAAG